ncbi:MAG: hypothetical protein DI617_08970 [Streptococcus pyogenes]|nr:MAG: hypothetical protein DI617_08970 [Streptococcus pyogenes]
MLSVDPTTLKLIKEKEKLYLGWNRVNCKEYIKVTQCFKCLKFGHFARVCKNEMACANCGGRHQQKECKEEVCCRNCGDFNLKAKKQINTKHKATARECPIYEKELNIKMSHIDYGY